MQSMPSNSPPQTPDPVVQGKWPVIAHMFADAVGLRTAVALLDDLLMTNPQMSDIIDTARATLANTAGRAVTPGFLNITIKYPLYKFPSLSSSNSYTLASDISVKALLLIPLSNNPRGNTSLTDGTSYFLPTLSLSSSLKLGTGTASIANNSGLVIPFRLGDQKEGESFIKNIVDSIKKSATAKIIDESAFSVSYNPTSDVDIGSLLNPVLNEESLNKAGAIHSAANLAIKAIPAAGAAALVSSFSPSPSPETRQLQSAIAANVVACIMRGVTDYIFKPARVALASVGGSYTYKDNSGLTITAGLVNPVSFPKRPVGYDSSVAPNLEEHLENYKKNTELKKKVEEVLNTLVNISSKGLDDSNIKPLIDSLINMRNMEGAMDAVVDAMKNMKDQEVVDKLHQQLSNTKEGITQMLESTAQPPLGIDKIDKEKVAMKEAVKEVQGTINNMLSALDQAGDNLRSVATFA